MGKFYAKMGKFRAKMGKFWAKSVKKDKYGKNGQTYNQQKIAHPFLSTNHHNINIVMGGQRLRIFSQLVFSNTMVIYSQ